MDFDLIRRAKDFAIEAHGTQKRKYTGVPYWYHLEEVACTLLCYTASAEVVAAGWLHDTLEDTPTQAAQLIEAFGPVITDLVLQVTDVSVKEHGNRAFRKRLDRQYLAGASWQGQMIKCADMLSNTRDIMDHDLGFARVYVPEKRKLIEALHSVREYRYSIWQECFDSIVAAEAALQREESAA